MGINMVNLSDFEKPLERKTFDFSLRVVNTCQELQQRKEYILSKQLLRSGTAIGALVREARYAESRADFTHKLAIALKEANESLYWLDLIFQAGYLSNEAFKPLHSHNRELL